MATRTITVKCPFCASEQVTKNGYNKSNKQVYRCHNSDCTHRSFVEEYSYKGSDPAIRRQVLDMTVNGNGTRATGRILGISKDTVTAILKKRNHLLGKLGK